MVGPLLAPVDLPGSFLTRPFVGLGWQDPRISEAKALISLFSAKPPELRFYLSRPLSVDVTLAGRCTDALTTVQVLLNGKPLASLPLTAAWKSTTLPVESDRVVEGLNLIQLREGRPCDWNAYLVSARDGGRGFGPTPIEPNRVGSELRLPFAHSVSFPVQLRPGSRLVLGDLQGWTEPGAPALEGPALAVRVRSEQPSFDRSWKLTGPGASSQPLEAVVNCQAELTLYAEGPGKPLPGQDGLRLESPRVESGETPEPSPTEVPRPPQVSRRPNVIIYLIDTLRSDHLGCYGYKKPITPNIDRLRRDSVLFANFTAQSSWTKTSTASILTSMLPRDHQAVGGAPEPGAGKGRLRHAGGEHQRFRYRPLWL